MRIEAQEIVAQAMSHIWERFNQEEKIVKITKYIPQHNKNYIIQMALAGIGTVFLEHPPHRSIYAFNELNEDKNPPSIVLDSLSSFQVKPLSNNANNVKAPTTKLKDGTQLTSKQSARTRRTSITNRLSQQVSKDKQKKDDKQLLVKNFALPSDINTNLHKLPAPSPSQEEIDLEFQLRALQKKLYFTRQSKKQQQQKQQERLKQLRKVKSPEKPNTDFTYQLNGNFLKRKPFASDELLADQMKVSQSFDFKPKEKKNLNELLQQVQISKRGRSQVGSRLQKANIFNNSNKRQVSHLPYIKMCDNSKIRQQNRNTQGNKTQRISLKSFSQSLQQKTFRHYSEIQRQKKQKELIARLQAQRAQKLKQQLDKNPQQPDDDGYNNITRRRQSYLMNRYLKKIKQQTPLQARKSLNFQRVGVAKDSLIHNYYKHNFNEQRKFYESEVISRVLQNSSRQK